MLALASTHAFPMQADASDTLRTNLQAVSNLADSKTWMHPKLCAPRHESSLQLCKSSRVNLEAAVPYASAAWSAPQRFRSTGSSRSRATVHVIALARRLQIRTQSGVEVQRLSASQSGARSRQATEHFTESTACSCRGHRCLPVHQNRIDSRLVCKSRCRLTAARCERLAAAGCEFDGLQRE